MTLLNFDLMKWPWLTSIYKKRPKAASFVTIVQTKKYFNYVAYSRDIIFSNAFYRSENMNLQGIIFCLFSKYLYLYIGGYSLTVSGYKHTMGFR